jgi:threonine dehydratase
VIRLEAPSLDAIHAARDRITGSVVRTPLLRLDVDSPVEIWLKLESLQPIGSFKLRGALNAMRSLPREALVDGVYTASAGNMAQGVAWGARELGVDCTVLVPDTAARTKIDSVRRLGARIVSLSFGDWWRVLVEHRREGMRGVFIHPVSDPAVIAGNATIGLEIAEDLPDVGAVFVPYGGGGLSCGIASALRAVTAATRVFACEVETAAPLSASLAAGRPVEIAHTPSWVTGIGGKSVLEEIWPLARSLLAGARVVSLAAVEDALRLLVARGRIVAEGAGAASVAAALAVSGPASDLDVSRVVCVVSGGNIDLPVLLDILGHAS